MAAIGNEFYEFAFRVPVPVRATSVLGRPKPSVYTASWNRLFGAEATLPTNTDMVPSAPPDPLQNCEPLM